MVEEDDDETYGNDDNSSSATSNRKAKLSSNRASEVLSRSVAVLPPIADRACASLAFVLATVLARADSGVPVPSGATASSTIWSVRA